MDVYENSNKGNKEQTNYQTVQLTPLIIPPT